MQRGFVIMLKVVKIRLYPNRFQRSILSQHFGASRFIYNYMLNKKNAAFKLDENLSPYDLKKLLVPMKQMEDLAWLKDIDATSLQQSVLNTATIKGKKLYLPKIGKVKAIFHRPVEGVLKTVTISMQAGQYYAAINFDNGLLEILGSNNGCTLALDMGVKIFAMTSEGEAIEQPNLAREESFLKKLRAKVSSKIKGSNNRKKAKQKLSKKSLYLKNKREDFLHKLTHRLSENQTIVVEDLNVKKMTKNVSGTIEAPGIGVQRKSNLNRSILAQGWYKFFTFLDYKLRRNGGELIKVNPAYTSQRCSACSFVSKSNRLSQSQFICTKCGFALNADYNAALNILKAVGTTASALPNVEFSTAG